MVDDSPSKTRSLPRPGWLQALGRGLKSPLSSLAGIKKSLQTRTNSNHVETDTLASIDDPLATMGYDGEGQDSPEIGSPAMKSDAMSLDDASDSAAESSSEELVDSVFRLRGGAHSGDEEPGEHTVSMSQCGQLSKPFSEDDKLTKFIAEHEEHFHEQVAPYIAYTPEQWESVCGRVDYPSEDGILLLSPPPQLAITKSDPLWPEAMLESLHRQYKLAEDALILQNKRLKHATAMLALARYSLAQEQDTVETLSKALDELESAANERKIKGNRKGARKGHRKQAPRHDDGYDGGDSGDDNDGDDHNNGGDYTSSAPIDARAEQPVNHPTRYVNPQAVFRPAPALSG